ncbi:hypothetical protein BC827DRAFT_1387318 [Russula dissimulans]|nr:hypothetical protein BC827DRAFT_1387318 [Russula dissimulans]
MCAASAPDGVSVQGSVRVRSHGGREMRSKKISWQRIMAECKERGGEAVGKTTSRSDEEDWEATSLEQAIRRRGTESSDDHGYPHSFLAVSQKDGDDTEVVVRTRDEGDGEAEVDTALSVDAGGWVMKSSRTNGGRVSVLRGMQQMYGPSKLEHTGRKGGIREQRVWGGERWGAGGGRACACVRGRAG